MIETHGTRMKRPRRNIQDAFVNFVLDGSLRDRIDKRQFRTK